MNIFTNPNFNFIKWRWHALLLSVAVILAGIGTIVARGGLPMGIDFTGGTLLELEFSQPTSDAAVRAAIDPISREAVVQQIGRPEDNRVIVRLPSTATQVTSLDEDSRRVLQALRDANLGSPSIRSSDIVGPVIGQDLQRKGVWATLTALGGILVYIALRFRFSFAVGAIAATFHDILITLVFLVWFNYDISLNIIAAILTITGYSVNDTIVIFDRVRENQRTMRREPLDVVVNRSVNQTLGRTIITGGTTFLAVVSLYLFGGEVLRGFAFTMLVGIVTGTYSTVFIAAAIAIILSRRPPSQTNVKNPPRLQRA
jgi:preprotein translocase subunit SecF